MTRISDHLVHHDVDDSRYLLEVAASLDDETYRRPFDLAGEPVRCWDGIDGSVIHSRRALMGSPLVGEGQRVSRSFLCCSTDV